MAALIALPITIGFSALALAVWPPEWMTSTLFTSSPSEVATGGAMWLLILMLPVILGAALHQLVLLVHARLRAAGHSRRFVVVTSPTILLGFALIPRATPNSLSAPILLPALALVLTYAVLAKSLPVQHASELSGDAPSA